MTGSQFASIPAHLARKASMASACAMALGLLSACTTLPEAAAPAAPAAAVAPAAAAVAAKPATVAQAAPAPAAPGATAPSAAAAPAAAASAPRPPAAAAAPPAPPAQPPLRAFADVTRTAKQEPGLFAIWREDDKVWLEIAESQLNKPFMITVNVRNAVGERGLYASSMGEAHMAEFRRYGRTVQLVLLNMQFRAEGDAAMARTVKESYSNSLMASTQQASANHTERKSFLVDASFLLSDLLGWGTRAEWAFRLPYGVDRANSYFDHSRATPGMSSLGMQLHFATPRIPAPPLMPPPFPMPPPPQTLPDARSFFLGLSFNMTALPEPVMPRRMADQRLGYFTESFNDHGKESTANNRVHLIARWRLEKKDPKAALSEPVKPITYWLDRNIPQRYRAAVTAGVLEWNKAFERAGFKDAVVVRQQPDDAPFELMDAEHASIRWFTGADIGYAAGPSKRDPRSGEIFDADIQMSDVFARGSRRLIREDVGMSAATGAAMGAAGFAKPYTPPWMAAGAITNPLTGKVDEAALCTYGDDKAAELLFALDVLEGRELPAGSPEVEAFVMAAIKDTIMHEVGHTLGLRHNFRASTTITPAQLRDKAYTSANGTAASVMDYNPYNLPLKGESMADASNPTLGAYDYWAIEYGYSQFAAADEAAGLAKILARSTEPVLAYADDRDAGRGPEGLDPRDSLFDQSSDPLGWAERRMQLSRELWQRATERGRQAGDEVERPRRNLMSGLRQVNNLPGNVAKFIGGVYAERDLPGTSNRAPFKPVESTQQRRALKFLTDSFFSSASFQFAPEFLASLGADYIEWDRAGPVSVPQMVLFMQRQALDRLFSPTAAQRLLDLPFALPAAERAGAISLNEVYSTLQNSVWSELNTTGPKAAPVSVDALRRNLQREHVRRLQALLVRAPANYPADALSLLRLQAMELQNQLKAATGKASANVETKAHLAESYALISEALKASMQRQ